MKVKELVANLLELDQEKDICIFYDQYARVQPEICIADKYDAPLKEGDYYFPAF